ncbi:MAG: nucleotide exchange factor GrpE [Ruminococcaceae bacterium]|nr:nucleotide exchange factor GrpE [Oscillospiraceae bacterium]
MSENKNTAEEIVEEIVEEVAEEVVETEAVETKPEKKKVKKLEAEIADLKKQLEARGAECDAANDKYMRMMAEYDNFRKRSAKEKDGIYADAYSDCIANLLPILDNLERAGKSDNYEAVAKGLELTVKAFDDALQKMGVTEIETQSFDPNLHNAVMHIEDDQYGENEIVEVFQRGYCKGDKVIRYAMVKVAN